MRHDVLRHAERKPRSGSGITHQVTFTVNSDQDPRAVARFVKHAIEGNVGYSIIGAVEVELYADFVARKAAGAR